MTISVNLLTQCKNNGEGTYKYFESVLRVFDVDEVNKDLKERRAG